MGMFGTDTKKFIGIAGDALLGLAGKPGVYGPAMAEQRQQQNEYQRQLQLAQFKVSNPEDPALIRSLQAAGIDPKSPQGQKIIQDNLSAPHYLTLGGAESGQTVINPSAPPPSAAAGPPPAAVSQLRQNPGSAAQFDEIFGQGAAQRALGGQ